MDTDTVLFRFKFDQPFRAGRLLTLSCAPCMSIASEIQKPSAGEVGGGETPSILTQVQTRAADYFPEFNRQALQVRVLRESRRIYSSFHEFEVTDGNQAKKVVVKIPCLPVPGGAASDRLPAPQRPRLFGFVDPQEMAELEFNSLVAIQEHFRGLDDPRFGTIRPLELLRDPDAVVMEKHPGASLRLIHRTVRRLPISRRPTPFSPDKTTQHAGAWLREYHRIGSLPHTSDRMKTRREFLEALAAQTGYLIDRGENRTWLESLRSEMEGHARRSLDAEFKLATSHGDYAPRNLLIDPDNRVSVIDTLARWRTPIFEDVAMFLLGLRASAAQVVSMGAAYDLQSLRDLESQFLTYYFSGETVPLASVRMFEVLLLLDRWSAFTLRAQSAKRSGRKLYTSWRLITLRRFLTQYVRHTFRELDQLR